MMVNNHLTFLDEEILAEGRGHNRALNISVKCPDHILTQMLVDNGSSLNVMLKSTIERFPYDQAHLKTSSTIVRAFDGSRREVMGETKILVQIDILLGNGYQADIAVCWEDLRFIQPEQSPPPCIKK
ncbi:hypothetical protein CR513_31856, partial [Mucuna pruriens]